MFAGSVGPCVQSGTEVLGRGLFLSKMSELGWEGVGTDLEGFAFGATPAGMKCVLVEAVVTALTGQGVSLILTAHKPVAERK